MFELIQNSAIALSTEFQTLNEFGIMFIAFIVGSAATALLYNGVEISNNPNSSPAKETFGGLMSLAGIAVFAAMLFSTMVIDYANMHGLITLV